MASLSSRLSEHSALFSSMIELIPANYYVFKEEDFMQSSKYFHNKKNKRKASKEEIITAKKARLDPTQHKSVEELVRKADETSERQNEETEAISESLSLNLERIESVPLSELRERLRNKIQECQRRRKIQPPTGSLDTDKRKVEKKSKKKEKGRLKKKEKGSVAQTGKENLVLLKEETQKIEEEMDSHDVQFNRFDVANPEETTGGKKHRKASLKQLLVKASEQQKRLEDIMEEDTEKGQQLKDKIKWQQAMKKVQSIPDKDDPRLLKKSLKREESRKKASRKKWEERLETQKNFQEKRQEKRKQHLKERIDSKKLKSSGKRKSKRKGTKRVLTHS